jgi:hypothetical protein
MPKKAAVRLYHQARAWDRATHVPGRHGGAIGRTALAVLHTLIFDFLCYRTGRLDPSYEGIAKKAGVSRASVGRALPRLRALGLLAWVRRCTGEMRDGRYVLSQERNAYAVQPEGLWKGYRPAPALPDTPQPGTWGDHAPPRDAVSQAVRDRQMGLSSATMLSTLASDPNDALALALARMGQGIMARSQAAIIRVSP